MRENTVDGAGDRKRFRLAVTPAGLEAFIAASLGMQRPKIRSGGSEIDPKPPRIFSVAPSCDGTGCLRIYAPIYLPAVDICVVT